MVPPRFREEHKVELIDGRCDGMLGILPSKPFFEGGSDITPIGI